MRTSIATVCVSGNLVEKMHACAATGFDGIEVFEPDLIGSDASPAEIRALAQRLGLSLDLYQPFRNFEGVDEKTFQANLRRAEAKFRLMQELGIDLMLLCSNVATATIDDDQLVAQQLRALGEKAAEFNIRVAFEALAWGTFINDYRHAWRLVQMADHPNVGICLDSFHILSRGHDPADIEKIPGEKIFYLQLADAPALSIDVLSLSRHHRLFPGEGSFDLATFVAHVLRTGYDGPLSLEIFNDTFRQTDARRTATHALRSLIWLEDAALRQLPAHQQPQRHPLTAEHMPTGFDFAEIKAEDTEAIEIMLEQLGFTFGGAHRSKPVRLWHSGDARIVLNEQQARSQAPHLSAVGLTTPQPNAAASRARELMAQAVYRRTFKADYPLEAVQAPDGTEVFWCDSPAGSPAPWVPEFQGGDSADGPTESSFTHIDHINLAQPWEHFDEAVLFYTAALGLESETRTDVAGPRGLVRSQVMRSPDGAVRVPLNLAPPAQRESLAQHVAVATDDVVAVARNARQKGMHFLPIPENYYADLQARYELDPHLIQQLQDLDLLYERTDEGEFIHFYTRTVGQVFMEVVERRGGYDGYGASNAPIRLAVQGRQR